MLAAAPPDVGSSTKIRLGLLSSSTPMLQRLRGEMGAGEKEISGGKQPRVVPWGCQAAALPGLRCQDLRGYNLPQRHGFVLGGGAEEAMQQPGVAGHRSLALAARHAAHKGVAHESVCRFAQRQLADHVLHQLRKWGKEDGKESSSRGSWEPGCGTGCRRKLY